MKLVKNKNICYNPISCEIVGEVKFPHKDAIVEPKLNRASQDIVQEPGTNIIVGSSTCVRNSSNKKVNLKEVRTDECFKEASKVLPSNLYTSLHKLRIMSNEERSNILLNITKDSLYDPTYHPIAAYRILSLYGSTDAELCGFFGIAMCTHYNWMVTNKEYACMVQKGKDVWDSHNIEAALRKSALGYVDKVVEQRIVHLEGGEYDIVNVEKEVHVKPNVKAAMSWLNKRSGRWKNKEDKKSIQEVNTIDYSALSIEELQELRFLLSKARSKGKQLPNITEEKEE